MTTLTSSLYHVGMVEALAQLACKVLPELFALTPAVKTQVLLDLAQRIDDHRAHIQQVNAKDVARAQANGNDAAFIDRLTLSDKAIDQMIISVKQVAQLDEVIGQINHVRVRPNGLKIGQMRVPIGVIGMIYESRPNVTIDAAILCFKSGNACILRGGSEAVDSNMYLAELMRASLKVCGVTPDAVQLIPSTDRQAVSEMLSLKNSIDLIIPRGGKSLIEKITQESKIPMIKHLDGICHTYIDADADMEQAVAIAFNGKCHRYAACNATETLLLHVDIAAAFLSKIAPLFIQEYVELRADFQSFEILQSLAYPPQLLRPAQDEDWHSEYLGPILAIKVVANVQDAITHINSYGSKHTDAIVTQNYKRSMQFMQAVDSASVMVNASTRFADGFEYGLGSEIGISNDKLHARGPVGLLGLTSEKYLVWGDGQIRI